MIVTVQGEVGPEQLGFVALAEHVLCGLAGWEDDPGVTFEREQVVERLLNALQEFRQAGGGTLVDSGGLLLGRDAELLLTLSTSAGVNIVASTGIREKETIPGHFLVPLSEAVASGAEEVAGPDADQLANVFYEELSSGTVVHGMRRTRIRAGVVVAGVSRNRMTATEELSLRGAALAAKRAGAALIANGIDESGRVLDILQQEGLPADRMVFGHCDDGRSIDIDRDMDLARSGFYVGCDHVGWEDPSVAGGMPDEQRVDWVKAMVRAGFTEQIVLSCNATGYAIDVPHSTCSWARLLTDFVPRLQKAGIGDREIETMLRENPRRVLTRR